jgi:hypothetical protein
LWAQAASVPARTARVTPFRIALVLSTMDISSF